MNECRINDDLSSSFEDILSSMKTDKYWINFFVRPCCPPPGMTDAIKSLDKRRQEIRERNDFTDDEKRQLLEIVDERQEWYMSSPFCKGR